MIISKKSEAKPIIETLKRFSAEDDYYGCVAHLHRELLSKRTKFPILEFTARELFDEIPACYQIAFCDKITSLNEIGSSVVTGIGLQLRLEDHFEESLEKAVEYVQEGNEWYHCDHIAERVHGFALLNYPEKTLPVLNRMVTDKDQWVVRMVGVAGHYAVKKGLKREYVTDVFRLILDNSHLSGIHVKSGLGWAAKTTAKFHPDIVESFAGEIESKKDVKKWFRKKVEKGLGRSEKFAGRFTE